VENYHSQPSGGSHHTTQRCHRSHGADEYDAYNEYDEVHHDEYDDEVQVDEEEGDDFPDHQLGLLRVPCSIAINSGEATNHAHDASSRLCSSQDKTPMAAYVDTGAQVEANF